MKVGNIMKVLKELQLITKNIKFNPLAFLVYLGLLPKSSIELRSINVKLHVDRISLKSLVPFFYLLENRVRIIPQRGIPSQPLFRIYLPWVNVVSPPLSLKELIALSRPITYFILLLNMGAKFDTKSSIISLNFYFNSPKFKIELWSDMHEALYTYYAEKLYDKLLSESCISLEKRCCD